MAAEEPRQAQLMLAIEAGPEAPSRLAALLAAAPVAAVVLRPAAGRPLEAATVLPLIAAGQAAGAAVLIEGDARLARTVKADGVHLPHADAIEQDYETARAIVGGRSLIGADAGRSRHAAMTLGEKGADYVAFGIPAFVREREKAGERQLELVAWWAEIFEVPSVAMDVAGPAEARALAQAGADLVCAAPAAGAPLDEAVRALSAFAAAIGAGEDAEAS